MGLYAWHVDKTGSLSDERQREGGRGGGEEGQGAPVIRVVLEVSSPPWTEIPSYMYMECILDRLKWNMTVYTWHTVLPVRRVANDCIALQIV